MAVPVRDCSWTDAYPVDAPIETAYGYHVSYPHRPFKEDNDPWYEVGENVLQTEA